jgi:hypothetical protein
MATDDRTSRKMKMDLKPKKLDSRPPRTGPIAMLKLRTVRRQCHECQGSLAR